MNVFEVLKREHKKILNQINQIEFLDQVFSKDKNVHQLFDDIKNIIIIEEKVFYSAICPQLKMHSFFRKPLEEHTELLALLQDLKSLPGHSPKWAVCLVRLKTMLAEHFNEEEGELFTIARCMLDKQGIDELSRRMKIEKMKRFNQRKLLPLAG